MANQFEVRVPNVLEAFMAGEQGYKTVRADMQDRQQRSDLSQLGSEISGGTIDYTKAAGRALASGNQALGFQLLTLAEAQKKQGREAEASKQFQSLFAPQSPAPGPQAAVTPTNALGRLMNTDPQGMAPARASVQPSAKVWGDAEAEAAGLYEKPAGRVASAYEALPPNAAPTQGAIPQPAAQSRLQSLTPEQLIGAVSLPNLPSGQKDIAKMLLAEKLKVNPEIQKLEAFRRDPALMKMAIELRRAGSTQVNVGDNSKKFNEELDKKTADRFAKYIDNADAAEKKMVDINSMREISARMGSQGAAAGVKEAVGPYAEALGINIEGLSDIQAYGQIIQRLAPQQRAPGSGSTSDVEFKGFLKSLPGLSQNPQAREAGLNTMEALSRDEIARGEIATKVSTGELSRVEAEKALRSLPDPMRGFVAWRKANPELYGLALSNRPMPAGAKARPVPNVAPKAGALEDGYRFMGGDPADPKSWRKVQ